MPNAASVAESPPVAHSPCVPISQDGGLPPIAIVGMAARLPGGVNSVPAMYQFLREKKDGLCPVPASRFNIDGFHNDGDVAFSMKNKKAYFLDDDVAMLDASFFGLSETEAAGSDPRARLLLEVVYECLENAGQTAFRGQKIGTYIGAWGVDWAEMTLKDGQQRNPMVGAAAGSFFLSSYIAWILDLHGPTGVLSPDGICKTFDASADGFGRAEAVNVVLLKPLDEAIRNGDVIRAVIRSTTVNNDGRTLILSTPSADAQEELIRHAYRKANINDIDQTAYFECHGTGTMAGDTAEMSAVANVFTKGIHVGSVKPNFGHSEGTSGITSLIKAVLSLEKRTILPHIHMVEPNPKIPFESAGLIVPKDETPWPAGRKERISVNNFAHSESSLRRRIEGIEKYLEEKPDSLHDLAFTLCERREHLTRRAFALQTEFQASGSFNVGTADCEHAPEVTFVFTGQGAQWPAMGKMLILTYERFRRTIRLLDQSLQSLHKPPAWSLQDLLSKDAAPGELNKAELAQPLCCAIHIGLVDLFAEWDIAPASVIGHSSGEIAAAYAAGALTAEDSIRVAYHRGQVLQKVRRKGGMAAIGLGRQQVTPYLVKGVVIACENSQHSVTLSGDQDQLNLVVEKIKGEDSDTLCRPLRVDKAYHSPHMLDASDEYECSLLGLSAKESSMLPLFSTVTGSPITEAAQLDGKYWRRNLESPVLFLTGIQAVLNSKEEAIPRVFVEIGPHSALSGPLRQIFSEHKHGESCAYIPSLVRGEEPITSVLYTAGHLYNAGVPMNLRAINGNGNMLVDLPPYPWQHDTKYWSQSPAVEAWRHRKYPHHELLGSRVLGSTDIEPSWRNTLWLDDAPWLYGHRVMGKTLFPGAGYIAMAGEAIQQISSSPGLSYQIRHLLLKFALFIDSNESIELITNLRPARVSDIQDSDWYEFSITAVQSAETTRVCVGQVRLTPASARSDLPPTKGTNFKRRVTSATWYKALREIGMDYNRQFRGLDDIYADPLHHVAKATVKTTKVSLSRYVMHPTTIDRCLQLLSVAMFRGLARNINIRSLPVLFEDILIRPANEELHVEAQADPGKGGFILGDLGATANDEVVLSVKGARLHIIGDDNSLEQESDLAARPAWVPHIDFLPPATMAKPPPPRTLESELRDRLVDLFIAETAARVTAVEPKEEYLLKYKRWLTIGQSRIENQGIWRLSDFGRANDCPFDSSTPLKMISWMLERAEEYPSLSPLAACMQRVLDNIAGVFEGTCNALHLLVEDDGLKDVYDFLLSFDSCNQFFATLGHSNPELNILEVGAGTGSATARFLDYLHAPDGSRLYSRYTFTDVSAGFLAAAKERFSKYEAMEYTVLNVNEDPAQQGFKLGHYDLIIASNVIHATPSLHRSLANIKSLLVPGGRLFLQELAEECRGAEYIFGLLPGWWVGEHDQRIDKPYVSVDRWRQELKSAGLNGIDFAIHEDTSSVVNLVSSSPTLPIESRRVNLLIPDKPCKWAHDVERGFQKRGYQVNLCALDQPPSVEGEVISLVDATEPFLFNATQTSFQQLKDFLVHPLVKRVLWVTKSSQITSPDPRYGLIHGFLRAFHGEVHTDGNILSIFDVDELGEKTTVHLLNIYEHLCRTQSVDPRREEYALRDGVVHVARFEAVSTEQELQSPAKDVAPRRLGIESTGLLDSMFWREDKLPTPAAGEDIITALGLIATPDQLGLEGSGIVQSVGSGISHVKPGEKAIFLGPGCFATHVTVPAAKVIPLPKDWSLEEGATSPIVSLTAAQCLLRLGNLHRGQSVLVHAAAGGVGIAAIRICKGIGATIYATVGSEAKVQYLIDTFDIPRSHIFNSRDSSFLSGLMRETNGRGVDIVLSSLSGELLRTSWECVSLGGTMFDISRRDVLADAMLPMKGFVDRRSFITVDLGEYMDEATNQSANFSIPVKSGLVGPISPVTCFDASDVAGAFRHMQTGQHIGKILVRMPEDVSELPTKDTRAEITLPPDNAYLLSGGLGGLGRALSNWMVEKGARCLVYLSPSAGTSEEHRHFAEELKCQGCDVVFVQGTASEIGDIQRAITTSPKPIRGVVQLALALKDVSLERMTFEDWRIPLTAKVDGTWNLHQAFQQHSLDFFIMFGSIAGVAGMAGQCNYSAANTFIHALAKHRNSLGQPASVIDLGPVADIGYVSRSPELIKSFSTRLECRFIKEQEALDAIEALIHHSSKPDSSDSSDRYDRNQIILGLNSTATWARQRGDARVAILSNRAQRQQESASGVDDIVEFVAQVDSDPEILNRPATEDFLIQKVGYMIKSPTTKSKAPAGKVDLKTLANIPIDSLIAIEARAWARKRLGVQISLSDITAAGNVKGLVGLAIDGMKKRYNLA
ncbi:acyl transferase domain-containing protein [Aspergillus undulatus]|uniref:acyl transferase domain-containing protein n=1 Tax=Aspergillus undulatus TaxID=1810928 RepID=UPI003CCCCC14